LAKKVASSATGFIDGLGYVGAAITGIGTVPISAAIVIDPTLYIVARFYIDIEEAYSRGISPDVLPTGSNSLPGTRPCSS